MDATVLMLGLFFGLVGMGMFMYGRSEHKYIHVGSGLALMVIPYFIPHAIVLGVVCLVIGAVPFVVGRGG